MDAVQPSEGTQAPRKEAGAAQPRRSFWRRRPVIIVGTIVLGVLFFFGLQYLVESFTHESTDDAFLDADYVSLAPRVAGQVKRVYVESNQRVKEGDLLLELDPRDFQVQVDQKEAGLKAARANVELLKASVDLFRTQIASAEATAKQSAAEANASQATADRANADLKRAEDLIRNQTISPQEYDSAKAAATAAQANLAAAKQKALSDQSKVAQSQAQLQAGVRAYERAEAQAYQSDWDLKAAQLSLSYTRLTAPAAGYVTKKAVAEGDYVQLGQKLMALVPDQGIYVTANFKETQLQQLRPGQPARIDIDSVKGGPFAAHVDSIMAGSGARFSLLPPENAVGNYVKVVQRVPVKLVFNQPPVAGHVLGPGMSVVPSVHVTRFEIAEGIVLAVAIVLALMAGLLWWALAGRGRQDS